MPGPSGRARIGLPNVPISSPALKARVAIRLRPLPSVVGVAMRVPGGAAMIGVFPAAGNRCELENEIGTLQRR